jgi:hypothetical protein
MHIDLGGAILLFVIGGFLGLIVLAVYRKGYREGQRPAPGPHESDYSEPTQPD